MNQTSRQEMNRELLFEFVQEVKKHSQTLRFPIYLSTSLMQKDLEELELSVRSINCLRRAGYQTIGQLVNSISGSGDLRSIRNCGRKSVCEIMSSLLLYQYDRLTPRRQEAFLVRTYFLSTHPEAAGAVEGGDGR